MLLEIKFYILNLRIFLPIFCCSLEILYLQYPIFFLKNQYYSAFYDHILISWISALLGQSPNSSICHTKPCIICLLLTGTTFPCSSPFTLYTYVVFIFLQVLNTSYTLGLTQPIPSFSNIIPSISLSGYFLLSFRYQLGCHFLQKSFLNSKSS